MSNIVWDQDGERVYSTGIRYVALYLPATGASPAHKYGAPVAWNGVTAINENPSGAEPTKIWADDINYLTLLSKEEFGGTIEAYQSPKEFDACDGTLQWGAGQGKNVFKIHGKARSKFGLSYFAPIGDDESDPGEGQNFICHIVYGCKASPSARDHATINDSPEATTMSWEFTTTPLSGTDIPSGAAEVAHIEIDCRDLTAAQFTRLKAILWDASTGYLPTPAEFAALNS